MRQILLATAALAAFAAGGQPAAAADFGRLSPQSPVGTPLAVENWTGLYVGGNVGHSWGRTELGYTIDALPSLSSTLNPNSIIGGGQIGYNWQFGSLVFGVEGDLAWRHGTDAATFTSPIPGAFASFSTEQNWAGTARPRVGFAAQHWLLYGTGGVAFGGFKHAYTEAGPGAIARGVANSDTKAGWTAGAGLEYALTNQWSLGVEYLYMDFGTTALGQAATPPLPASTATFDDKSHLVRAKVNFKFNWTTPFIGR